MRRGIDLLSENRLRLSREEALAELRADIVRAAYVEGDFVFASGLRRGYYFDKYLFETRPAILRRLARFLAELVPEGTERLVAPALGAVALGTAISLESGLPLAIVRPDPEPGSPRAIEGELYAGENVALIEDVVVTGGRALRAISRVREAGANARHAVAVLDRREGAEERFAEHSASYAYLFTPEDLGID
ncbi:orotate phosphoribosyltransferase [Rubrobacter marinus]|uniref:Orotate phosphoribosyltransferase n=1 Tax=Rubrobacter marinus TaxID=2653852 RepID=A0A6G8PWB2_9ACTN|nr:phosphoribosyltransferase family protein [Rubrobacter marinus]QIN78499.1 orotate phosphoribosyltransferase [Rubrobacter marinus]